MKRDILYLAIASVVMFGCGGGNEWGIDHSTGVPLSHGPLDPVSGMYRCKLEDASLVKPGETVEPLSDDTQIRVWHFQNSEEYVCLLKGEAIIRPSVGGEG